MLIIMKKVIGIYRDQEEKSSSRLYRPRVYETIMGFNISELEY